MIDGKDIAREFKNRVYAVRISEAQIRHIFVEIANGRDNRGAFLRSFAEAIMRADPENLALLMPAAIAIARKYDLAEYLDNYVAANFP